MRRYQIVWLVAFVLLGLAPVQAEATSHSLAQLCAKINCPSVLAAFPVIEKGFGNIRPGGSVFIGGRRFGSAPGKVVLKLESGHEVELTHLEWFDEVIGAQIPCNMVAIPTLRDQKATLRVVTKGGAVSTAWGPVPFFANAVQVLLPMRDTKKITCVTDAQYNHCNDLADAGGDLVASGKYSEVLTLQGGHSNAWGTGWGAGVGTDKGTDIYEYKLANGWVFVSQDFKKVISEAKEGSVSFVTGCPKGGTSCSASVSWTVTPWDSVYYHSRVGICGPPGTKWK